MDTARETRNFALIPAPSFEGGEKEEKKKKGAPRKLGAFVVRRNAGAPV